MGILKRFAVAFSQLVIGLVAIVPAGAEGVPYHLTPARPPCTCASNLKHVQIELKNAEILRSRFEAMRDSLQSKLKDKSINRDEASDRYNRWLASRPDKDLERAPGAGIEDHVNFVPLGSKLVEDVARDVDIGGYVVRRPDQTARDAVWSKNENAKPKVDLCAPVDPDAFYRSLSLSGSCAEISEATLIHEQVHIASCRERRYFGYWYDRDGSDLADEEVKAYTAQIRALQRLVGRMLEGATLTFNGSWKVKVDLQGFGSEIRHDFKAPPIKLEAGPDDTFVANGRATQQHEILRSVYAGQQCRITSGKTSATELQIKVQTDGSTQSVSIVNLTGFGAYSHICPKGRGEFKDSYKAGEVVWLDPDEKRALDVSETISEVVNSGPVTSDKKVDVALVCKSDLK